MIITETLKPCKFVTYLTAVSLLMFLLNASFNSYFNNHADSAHETPALCQAEHYLLRRRQRQNIILVSSRILFLLSVVAASPRSRLALHISDSCAGGRAGGRLCQLDADRAAGRRIDTVEVSGERRAGRRRRRTTQPTKITSSSGSLSGRAAAGRSSWGRTWSDRGGQSVDARPPGR